MALSEIIRKLFRLLVTRWNLFTSSFLSFCLFIHSVYVCVCVFLCHYFGNQQRWLESSFLLNIFNFMQKKIQILSMVFPSEWILCSGEMLKHWLCEQFFVHYNTTFLLLCYCQAYVVTSNKFSTGFLLVALTRILLFLFVPQCTFVFEIVILLRVWIVVQWLFSAISCSISVRS